MAALPLIGAIPLLITLDIEIFDALIQWEQEHLQLLMQIAPQTFTIRHYAAIAQLQPK